MISPYYQDSVRTLLEASESELREARAAYLEQKTARRTKELTTALGTVEDLIIKADLQERELSEADTLLIQELVYGRKN